jgi:hypothetical protein
MGWSIDIVEGWSGRGKGKEEVGWGPDIAGGHFVEKGACTWSKVGSEGAKSRRKFSGAHTLYRRAITVEEGA